MATNSNTKPQPVLIAFSIMAGLTTLVAGLATLGYDQKVIGLFSLILAVINVIAGVYVKGLVVPFTDTAAYVDDNGDTVAGPAANLISDGRPVEVLPSQPITP